MTDDRPCPYCWHPTSDEKRLLEEEGVLVEPEGGFAPIHPLCQEALDSYLEEHTGD